MSQGSGKPRSSDLPSWLVYTSILAVVVASAYSGLAGLWQRKSPPTGYGCSSNVKQVAMAQLMYASDYDRRLPSRDLWVDQSLFYSRNLYLYHCPHLGEWSPTVYGYAFNSRLSEGSLAGIKDSASTVMVSVTIRSPLVCTRTSLSNRRMRS